ncbi:diphthamide biosynthesis protein [Lentithecium fluviatile CBS 122367]|uniref:2-(3-amino-3-carboxypropyl)histidine synthase subunit 2 n=1 Tax=Lentithecium fluviatile CBS 122367 TaxID=1168545 RepID=A0A6G1JIG4_9PLEO|nr:diphthamide biosynthesis protein [Lentithecium fluviatile CBS 122367]
MSVPPPSTAPVLSTPDTHIFEDPTPAVDPTTLPRLQDEQVAITYEIERTVREIREGRWKRIALQFPDGLLVDAPRVYEQLRRGLARQRTKKNEGGKGAGIETEIGGVGQKLEDTRIEEDGEDEKERLFILADTSYGACCVDEVAAEHVDADVVVHYGRSCLSPPSRLPIVYVFTKRPLDLEPLVATFKKTYPDKAQKTILMADTPYSHHVPTLYARLQEDGYTQIYATEIMHDPSSLLPNRTVPLGTPDAKGALQDWQLFHISDPPQSLILTLSSRVASTYIYPTDTPSPTATLASTSLALRRRYALLTSLSTTSVFGILINTLSVKNYMHILSHVQRQITNACKKYYTFVVGKVNAAKIANFSEIGGWVVIGCWESSLIESKEFWRPIITPFELEFALQGDEERVWTGEWRGDFQSVLEEGERPQAPTNGAKVEVRVQQEVDRGGIGGYDFEEESAPPEFDLRTGRYISHSRPMRTTTMPKPVLSVENGQATPSSSALTKRANGDLAQVGGVVSPGAEFLRENRTWQGLGSDYTMQEKEGGVDGQGARMQEGRSGIARGYVVGGEERVH